ncbi:MAG: hypothetical protein PWP08_1563 [Methanofollis sp.]|nr:hypothetical protein [Methanofollis sp.]
MGTVVQVLTHKRLGFLIARELCHSEKSSVITGTELLDPVPLSVLQRFLRENGLFVHVNDTKVIQDLVFFQ